MRVPGNISAIENEVINIRVKEGQDSNPADLKILGWTVVKFTANQMQIQLNF